MLKRLLAVSAAMVLTVGSYAIAAELQKDHPSTYVVVKGDTLWDIAGRFLRKPWQWPEIWQANPQIANPHLIYPGDVISLAYLDGQPTLSTSSTPRIRVGDPVNAIPLSEVQAFLKQMEVRGDDVRNLPYIVGLEDDRLISSAGQVAYASGLSAQVGDKVRIVRPTAQYFAVDPPTRALRDGVNPLDFRGRAEHRDWELVWSEARISDDRKGKFLGNEVMTQAVAQVTQVRGDTAVLLLSEEGRDVRPGDRILPFDDKPYDATYFPHPPTSVPADVRVLAIADGLRAAGSHSVIALAAGSAQGVDNGSVFSIWSPGARHADNIKYGNALFAKANSIDLPDEFDGHAMVFRTFDNVSYALVMDGIRPVKINDRLKHPDATE